MEKVKTNIGTEYWIIIGLSYLLSVFFIVIFLDEFIKVGIFNNIDNYHFGTEGIWYYKTASAYALNSLIWCVLFSTSAVVVTIGLIQKRKLFIILSFLFSIFLILILLYGVDHNL